MESQSTTSRPAESSSADPGGSQSAPPAGDEFYRDAMMQLVNERAETNVLLDRIASALEHLVDRMRDFGDHFGVIPK